MKQRIDLKCDSSQGWVDAVMDDFNAFLQDHANCERKASSMAMSFVAKFPDRLEIIPELIETAVEELEHFRDVYAIMQDRQISLPHEITKDEYMADLIDLCRSGKEDRFMDRLLLASLVETRGAERFKLIYEPLEPGELKNFYRRLWASEAKHGEIFVDMALQYFEKDEVYNRLELMSVEEAKILRALPLRAALH